MAASLKLRKIGSSVGIIIPKEELKRMHVREGDELFATVEADGMHLSPYDPEFAVKLKAFERTRRRYRNALRELAK